MPGMKRAFVFPGQGSQAPGMGRELAEAFTAARLLFEEVDDALSQHLSRLMFEGPESDLKLTENAQPALLAASLAVIRVLESEAGFDLARQVAYVAGHSLGEYSAIAAEAAGSGVCDVANDNCPGQIVVSGSAAAVERAVALAAARGSRRSIMLPVSAPFHCRLMAPAAEIMADALNEVAWAKPVVPLVANVTARPTTDIDEIRELLVEQVTRMVRWRETVLLFKDNEVEEVVEIGTGKVLAGLVRHRPRELAVISVGTPAEAEQLMKRL